MEKAFADANEDSILQTVEALKEIGKQVIDVGTSADVLGPLLSAFNFAKVTAQGLAALTLLVRVMAQAKAVGPANPSYTTRTFAPN